MKTRTEIISDQLIKIAFSVAILIIAFISGVKIKDGFAEAVGDQVLATSSLSKAKIFIAGEQINVRLAVSAEEREKGLSGVAYLPHDSGMLFDFGTTGFHGIWMKDMKFPIDIIWFDDSMRAIHIEERVEPQSYPYIFKPKSPALYVLEMPTGFIELSDIKIGNSFSFAK